MHGLPEYILILPRAIARGKISA